MEQQTGILWIGSVPECVTFSKSVFRVEAAVSKYIWTFACVYKSSSPVPGLEVASLLPWSTARVDLLLMGGVRVIESPTESELGFYDALTIGGLSSSGWDFESVQDHAST